MTRAVYIIGAAGAGKSRFMDEVLNFGGWELEPEEVTIHARPNTRQLVPLRGHEVRKRSGVGPKGIYLGRTGHEFPGTDGLNRACTPVGIEWLTTYRLPDMIVAEGGTMATRPFLYALHQATNLLLVHLDAEDFLLELRWMIRGQVQTPKFIQASKTKSVNLASDMEKRGTWVRTVNAGDPEDWRWGIQNVVLHLDPAYYDRAPYTLS